MPNSLLFYSYYNPKNIKKLISKYSSFHTYMNGNYLDLKPRRVNTVKIKKCKYNYYKIALFLIEEEIQRKVKFSSRYGKQVKNKKSLKNRTAIFLPEETHVIYDKTRVPLFRTYVDLKFLLDLCNGTHTIREIISLLSDKYTPSVSDFPHYPNLIKALLTEGIISLIKSAL